MNSTLYFAAAALLLFAAGLSAGRNVHGHLTKPKLMAMIAAITIAIILIIWLLLIGISRKEGEPPRQPADYSATTGTG